METAVYDFDAPWVHLGAAATMKLSYDPGRTFDAKVSFVDPTLDERTRTLRVRLEVPNPGLKLKPGMFATVDIETTPRNDAIIIPTEAVIRSGSREVVFVVHQLGHYEARQITTGVSGADYETQVLAGLKPGERVVTSGQFLLDSESQLREAVAKMSAKGLEQPPAKAEGRRRGPRRRQRQRRRRQRQRRRRRHEGHEDGPRPHHQDGHDRRGPRALGSPHDRLDHREEHPQPATGPPALGHRRRRRGVGDGEHPGGRHPRPLGRAGHRLHQLRGTVPGRGRGPGHLPPDHRHALGALRQDRARVLVLRLLPGLRDLQGRNRPLLGPLPGARVPELRQEPPAARGDPAARPGRHRGRLGLRVHASPTSPPRRRCSARSSTRTTTEWSSTTSCRPPRT